MGNVGFMCPKCGCTECDEHREWNGVLRAGLPGKLIGRKCCACNEFIKEPFSAPEEDVGGSGGMRSKKEE